MSPTPLQGVLLHKDCNMQLSEWCDSNWVVYPLIRRSFIGWFILLGSSSIS